MKTVFIYALKDPRDGAVKYIGKTETPNYRFRAHLRSKPGTHKAHWIRQLKDLDLVPSMDILDEVPNFQWEFFERAYIKVYRESGAALTNIADGGDGGPLFAGHTHSEESKAKTSKSLKGRSTGPKSPEHRAKLSESLLGRPLTKEHREAISAGTTGERNHNFGVPMPEEQRAKLRKPKSEAHRKALSLASRGKKRGPYKKRGLVANV